MVVKTIGVNNTPTARIAVNKNIVKHYHKSDRSNAENSSTFQLENVYLTGNTEFQIELFNPTQGTVSAKIKLNGNYISGGGIVIYPGQRIFLDRYLDVAKKFKFDTYEVSGNNAEVEKAIENNGLVEVEFYEEYIPIVINSPFPAYTYDNIYRPSPSICDNITCGFVQTDFSTTTGSATIVTDSIGDEYQLYKEETPQKRSKKITKETGRIGKGDYSKQEFNEVNISFNFYPSHTVRIQILPNSEKQHNANDIYKMRKYCSECGAKVKPQFKFCPNCSTKL